MKVTLESSSDSLRSSVSSPGMPNTYLTPSASRHSTNRSDALRSLIPETSTAPPCRANLGLPPSLMARILLPTLLACLLAAAPASAAPRLTIRGAGFGHGVGMSQYGAYGFAQQGAGYQAILAHYYQGTQLGTVDPQRTVRVLLQATGGSAAFTGVSQAGSRPLDPAKTYRVSRRGSAEVDLRSASG